MVSRSNWFLAGLAAVVLFAGEAFATNGERASGGTPDGVCATLPVDEPWTDSDNTPPRFYWGADGPIFSTDCFEVTSGRAIEVQITDAFFGGDQFRLYVDGNPVGETDGPPPPDSGAGVSDPVAAYQDDRYSSGSFVVPAGTHELTIEVITNPFNSGGAYIQVNNETLSIPTLGRYGVAVLALGLVALALVILRRRRAA